VSVQEALLYFGAYVSQGLVRRAVGYNDKTRGAREILIATDRPRLKPDLLKTARLVGLDRSAAWYAPSTGPQGARNFLSWAGQQIVQYDSPVAFGVILRNSDSQSVYDHIVTAT